MSRRQLHPDSATPAVVESRRRYQSETLDEVENAVNTEDVVVIGMGWNPHVGKARKNLDKAGIAYKYLGYGNYLTGWKPRLAIKLWAGWPTFPQIFVKGTLVGGNSNLVKALEDGSFKELLAGPRK